MAQNAITYEIKPLDQNTRNAAVNLITDHWGSNIIVSKGKIHLAENLDGFTASDEHGIKGLITYGIAGGECEIVSLDSLYENIGIGSTLIDKVVEKAKEKNLKRVWLITTNDNTHAIRFYQKRGFNIAAIHLNAIEKSRKIKPQIPLYGCDDIPIRHEIEFEKLL